MAKKVQSIFKTLPCIENANKHIVSFESQKQNLCCQKLKFPFHYILFVFPNYFKN